MNMQNDIQESPKAMTLAEYVAATQCNTVQLQAAIGIPGYTFSKYMSGTRTPDAETAVLIHKVTKGRVPVWIWPRYAAFKEFLSDG